MNNFFRDGAKRTVKRSLVRIDNRLVHGQILESWVPFLHASSIVVVNDEVAGDIFRESVIRMAVPRDIEVVFCGIDGFAQRQNSEQEGDNRGNTIILFESIGDVIRAYRLGFRFEALNVGNVQNKGDRTRKIGTRVHMSDGEIEDLMMLVRLGVDVEIRSVPRDRSVSFAEAVGNARGD
ncbi:MAG: hypothetical protein AVO39_02615 [delta proteobacterium MLS_D]|nr:MAG: hypothetical protein AVO39_02615 [delta proteobacterium MLS_D]